ncbi:MAG TPA: TonB-dependent receptor [Albitalea sp.]
MAPFRTLAASLLACAAAAAHGASEPPSGPWLAFGPVAATDPAAPPAAGAQRPRGVEAGWRLEAEPGRRSALSLWTLSIDEPVVHALDADAREPVRAGRRRGLAGSHRHEAAAGWHVEAGLAWWRTHLAGADETGRPFAGTSDRVASIGLGWHGAGAWRGGVQARHHRSGEGRAAWIADLQAQRRWGRDGVLSLAIANVFDRPVEGLEAVVERQVRPLEARTVTLSLSLPW